MVAQTYSQAHIQTHNESLTERRTATHEAVAIGPNRTIHIPLAAFVGKVRAYCIDWRGDTAHHEAVYNEDFLALRAVRALASYRFCAGIKLTAPLIVGGKDGKGNWQVSRALRSDGLWEVVAVRTVGKECENASFPADSIDFGVWIAHLS